MVNAEPVFTQKLRYSVETIHFCEHFFSKVRTFTKLLEEIKPITFTSDFSSTKVKFSMQTKLKKKSNVFSLKSMGLKIKINKKT